MNATILSSDGEIKNRAEGVGGSVTEPTSLEAESDPFTPLNVKSRSGAILTLLLSTECSPSDVIILIRV